MRSSGSRESIGHASSTWSLPHFLLKVFAINRQCIPLACVLGGYMKGLLLLLLASRDQVQ